MELGHHDCTADKLNMQSQLAIPMIMLTSKGHGLRSVHCSWLVYVVGVQKLNMQSQLAIPIISYTHDYVDQQGPWLALSPLHLAGICIIA